MRIFTSFISYLTLKSRRVKPPYTEEGRQEEGGYGSKTNWFFDVNLMINYHDILLLHADRIPNENTGRVPETKKK